MATTSPASFVPNSQPSTDARDRTEPDLESAHPASTINPGASDTNSEEVKGSELRLEYDKDVERIENMPPGLLKLAAEQHAHQTMQLRRRFGTLRQKLFLLLQQDLAACEEKMDGVIGGVRQEMGVKSTAEPTDVLPVRDGSISGSSIESDFTVQAGLKLQLYDFLLFSHKEFKKIPLAPLPQHRSLYERMRNEHNLSEEECRFMERADDFINTDAGLISSFVAWIMEYSPNPRLQAFKEAIKACFRYKGRGKEPYFHTGRFITFCQHAGVALISAILLVPVLLLYLVYMSKGASVGVVVAFVVVSAPIFAFHQSARFVATMVCLAALLTLSVSFLAQMQDSVAN